MVALAGIAASFVAVIFALIPRGPAGDNARMALLGVITTACTAVVTYATNRRVSHVQDAVNEVGKQVNGRMSQLIAAKTQPDPDPDGAADLTKTTIVGRAAPVPVTPGRKPSPRPQPQPRRIGQHRQDGHA